MDQSHTGWCAIGWLLGGLMTALFSGAGFIITTMTLEYLKEYFREKLAKERAVRELLDTQQEWSSGQDMLHTELSRRRIRHFKGASLFDAYKRSPVFLGNTYPKQKITTYKCSPMNEEKPSCSHLKRSTSNGNEYRQHDTPETSTSSEIFFDFEPACKRRYEISEILPSSPIYHTSYNNALSGSKEETFYNKKRHDPVNISEYCQSCALRSQGITLWSPWYTEPMQSPTIRHKQIKARTFCDECHPHLTQSELLRSGRIKTNNPNLVIELINRSGHVPHNPILRCEFERRSLRLSPRQGIRKESEIDKKSQSDGPIRKAPSLHGKPDQSQRSLKSTSLRELGSKGKSHVTSKCTIDKVVKTTSKQQEGKTDAFSEITRARKSKSLSSRRRYRLPKSLQYFDELNYNDVDKSVLRKEEIEKKPSTDADVGSDTAIRGMKSALIKMSPQNKNYTKNEIIYSPLISRNPNKSTKLLKEMRKMELNDNDVDKTVLRREKIKKKPIIGVDAGSNTAITEIKSASIKMSFQYKSSENEINYSPLISTNPNKSTNISKEITKMELNDMDVDKTVLREKVEKKPIIGADARSNTAISKVKKASIKISHQYKISSKNEINYSPLISRNPNKSTHVSKEIRKMVAKLRHNEQRKLGIVSLELEHKESKNPIASPVREKSPSVGERNCAPTTNVLKENAKEKTVDANGFDQKISVFASSEHVQPKSDQTNELHLPTSFDCKSKNVGNHIHTNLGEKKVKDSLKPTALKDGTILLITEQNPQKHAEKLLAMVHESGTVKMLKQTSATPKSPQKEPPGMKKRQTQKVVKYKVKKGPALPSVHTTKKRLGPNKHKNLMKVYKLRSNNKMKGKEQTKSFISNQTTKSRKEKKLQYTFKKSNTQKKNAQNFVKPESNEQRKTDMTNHMNSSKLLTSPKPEKRSAATSKHVPQTPIETSVTKEVNSNKAPTQSLKSQMPKRKPSTQDNGCIKMYESPTPQEQMNGHGIADTVDDKKENGERKKPLMRKSRLDEVVQKIEKRTSSESLQLANCPTSREATSLKTFKIPAFGAGMQKDLSNLKLSPKMGGLFEIPQRITSNDSSFSKNISFGLKEFRLETCATMLEHVPNISLLSMGEEVSKIPLVVKPPSNVRGLPSSVYCVTKEFGKKNNVTTLKSESSMDISTAGEKMLSTPKPVMPSANRTGFGCNSSMAMDKFNVGEDNVDTTLKGISSINFSNKDERAFKSPQLLTPSANAFNNIASSSIKGFGQENSATALKCVNNLKFSTTDESESKILTNAPVFGGNAAFGRIQYRQDTCAVNTRIKGIPCVNLSSTDERMLKTPGLTIPSANAPVFGSNASFDVKDFKQANGATELKDTPSVNRLNTCDNILQTPESVTVSENSPIPGGNTHFGLRDYGLQNNRTMLQESMLLSSTPHEVFQTQKLMPPSNAPGFGNDTFLNIPNFGQRKMGWAKPTNYQDLLKCASFATYRDQRE